MSLSGDLPSILSNLVEAASDDQRTALAQLLQAAQEGHVCLETPVEMPAHPLLHREGPYLYLQRHWALETRILHHLRRLRTPLPALSAPPSDLSAEQHAAVELALSHPLSFITGGPGTGKTHVARALAQMIPGRIVLAAPTGKAAARLQAVRSDALCGTLHAVLGLRSARDLAKEGSYLKADLLLVDESSMIDLSLFAFLLASIQTGTRVVFLGDADQLPSVGAGSIFADLVDVVPTARLTHSFRSDHTEILSLADAVRRGDPEPILQALTPFNPFQEEACILSCLKKGPTGSAFLTSRSLRGYLTVSKPANRPLFRS